MSLFSATSRGDAASFAPLATSGSAFATVRVKMVAGYPALMRCSHMERPITPCTGGG